MPKAKSSPRTKSRTKRTTGTVLTPRERRLRDIFNTTSEEYEKALIEGGGGCAISGRTHRKDGLPLVLSLDHDHRSGLLRGVLSNSINKGLSYFDDDPALLRAAAAYLEDPPYVRANGPIYGVIGRVPGKRKKKSNCRFGPPTSENPKGTKESQPRDVFEKDAA